MKATEQYFPVVLFIMLYKVRSIRGKESDWLNPSPHTTKVVPTLNSVDK